MKVKARYNFEQITKDNFYEVIHVGEQLYIIDNSGKKRKLSEYVLLESFEIIDK